MKNTSIIFAVVVVLVGAGSFFGGMQYQKGKGLSGSPFAQAQGRARAAGQFGQGGQGTRGANGGFVNGDVLSKDPTSVTIKMRDGSSKIVFYTSSTRAETFVDGSVNDVAVGQTVMVTGTSNSDGSVTAQSIQVRPAMPSVPVSTQIQ